MPYHPILDQVAERVERLLLRHEELQRTNALLSEQVEALTQERNSLKSRLSAARARVDALLERLEELRDEGQQVLVFSQFVSLLELIEPRLKEAGIGYLMLTGATENRGELVDQFQSDKTKTVFLLSLKAAGSGLNLTAASYVILCDPWWNPAVEAQAIDRTHRIGQTQPVVAYRLVAADTVEQKILAMQKDKAALANAVVQEESLASVLDLDSLRQILG